MQPRRDYGAEAAAQARAMLKLERSEEGSALERPALLDTVTADAFCDGELGPIDYLCKPIFVRGGSHDVYGHPKVGKTTFVMHAIHAMLDPEWSFLDGAKLIGGQGLLLDLEQPRRVTHRRLAQVGASPMLHVYRGEPPELARLYETIDALGVKLLAVDSVSRMLMLENENDNSEIERKLAPIITALQARDVTSIWIDHAGKMDAATGRNLRGGSAKLGIFDIITELKAEGPLEDGRRRLCFTSREEPHPELIVRLVDGRYILEGTAATVALTQNADRIMNGILAGHNRKDTLAAHLTITEKTLEGWVKPLVERGMIGVERTQARGAPIIYTLPISRSSRKSLGSSPNGAGAVV